MGMETTVSERGTTVGEQDVIRETKVYDELVCQDRMRKETKKKRS